MLRKIRIGAAALAVAACLLPLCALPQESYREEAAPGPRDHTNTPLVIIRFNQQRVYFQRPLYTAVSRALEVKPAARFTLVSVVPTHGGESQYRVAESNFGQVLQSMREMGIPPYRMTADRRSSNAVQDSEVHVYVQ